MNRILIFLINDIRFCRFSVFFERELTKIYPWDPPGVQLAECRSLCPMLGLGRRHYPIKERSKFEKSPL